MATIAETRAKLRALMPIVQKCAYFDHAAMCALPQPTADAFQKWLSEATEIGGPVWGQWVRGIEATRASAAALIRAQPEEIALVSNTTAGISLVAEGLDWREGDNVVTFADEFPSNQYPWMNLSRRGVETRRVPNDVTGRSDLNALAAACDRRTRIVSVSWVGFATGYRHDIRRIAEIAHEHGALVFIDAIQGLGAFPLDVNEAGVDFLAADGHKWLLGPEGAGIAYIRREHLAKLRPIGPGWHSVSPTQEFTHIELKLREAAARYEGGSQNSGDILALGASLKMLQELGLENLAAAVLDITDQACEKLQAIGAQIISDRRLDHRDGKQRSGIVAFEMPGKEPMALKRYAGQQKVVFGCRAGRLRISPHAYNNEEDLDRLVEALTTFKA
ncbi:MAG TPA: aminotransferase class V-fold PLP-dependent enzyme [Lacipirellulaceae bacterium]|jgi:selenocysteine lyase/cysteine desulfurase|nr:aminotransferase class V-fold PLP-dependent enzyme [Lacipirellulaceae bacterium]